MSEQAHGFNPEQDFAADLLIMLPTGEIDPAGRVDTYTVGERRAEWIHSDGMQLEYDNVMGLIGFVYISRPSAGEKFQLSTDRQFRISFVEKEHIGFLVTEISHAFIFDAPFSPNIYRQERELGDFSDEHIGLSFLLMFIDGSTGELFQIRQIGLGHKFTVNFLRWYKKALAAYGEMSREEYSQRLDSVYSKYSIEQLQRDSTFSWRL